MEVIVTTLSVALLMLVIVGAVMAVTEYDKRGAYYLAVSLIAAAISVFTLSVGHYTDGFTSALAAVFMAVNWRIAKLV